MSEPVTRDDLREILAIIEKKVDKMEQYVHEIKEETDKKIANRFGVARQLTLWLAGLVGAGMAVIWQQLDDIRKTVNTHLVDNWHPGAGYAIQEINDKLDSLLCSVNGVC